MFSSFGVQGLLEVSRAYTLCMSLNLRTLLLVARTQTAAPDSAGRYVWGIPSRVPCGLE